MLKLMVKKISGSNILSKPVDLCCKNESSQAFPIKPGGIQMEKMHHGPIVGVSADVFPHLALN